MENQEQILQSLQADMTAFIGRHAEEVKTLGSATKETSETLIKMQKQLDAIDIAMQKSADAGKPEKSMAEELRESEDFKRLVRDGKGTARIQVKGGFPDLLRKTTITSAAIGNGTGGILMPQYLPGIVGLAQPMPVMRDVIPAAPTSANAVFFVKELAFTNNAAMQIETSPKAESALTYTVASATVQTLAHWIPVAKQVLDDFDGLAAAINGKLMYGLKIVEEAQILSGSGTGQDLDGLITQATAYSGTYQSVAKGWTKMDQIRHVITQLQVGNLTGPGFIVVNPIDWADIETAKDSLGRYLVGDPRSSLAPNLWGVRVVPTNNISSGTFLAGNSGEAQIRDRMDAVVEVSTEHSDYFTRNMVAVRAEERLTLVVFRPTAFITGSFSNSPA